MFHLTKPLIFLLDFWNVNNSTGNLMIILRYSQRMYPIDISHLLKKAIR